MVMKIENYRGLADTFTFPNNPLTYDDTVPSSYTLKVRNYRRFHTLISGNGILPKSTILTGHFNGTNKRTHYQDLSKHFQETAQLKKLYWESDKFILGVGTSCKQTNTGMRTNFIDYIANFAGVIGILFGDTQRTSGTNNGNVSTFIEEITGTVTSGASDITISDNLGNSFTVNDSKLTTGYSILYKFVSLVSVGYLIFTAKYGYFGVGVDSGTTSSTTAYKLVQTGQNFESTVKVGDIVKNNTDGTESIVIKVDSDTILTLYDDIMTSGETYTIFHQVNYKKIEGKEGLPQLRAAENVSNISTTNITSAVKTFRDGWSD